MIRAICRLVCTEYSRQTEVHFYFTEHCYTRNMDIPSFGYGDEPSRNWMDALVRFGHIQDERLLYTAMWSTWARAIILGMLNLTYCTRELMFADDVFLLGLRGARSPSTERRRALIPQLVSLHADFNASGYIDVERFVLRAASCFYFDVVTDERAESLRFLLQEPIQPPRKPDTPLPTDTQKKEKKQQKKKKRTTDHEM